MSTQKDVAELRKKAQAWLLANVPSVYTSVSGLSAEDLATVMAEFAASLKEVQE